jgi:hypothetical protein
MTEEESGSHRAPDTAPAPASPGGWSERRNWIYGVLSAALAGLIVVVIQTWLGLGSGDGGGSPAAASSSSADRTAGLAGGATVAARAKAEEEPVISASVSYLREQCASFVVPGSLDTYGPAPDSSELSSWARERGAAMVGPALIMVTVTGHDERPVTITDLTFSTSVQEAAPMSGTVVSNECGDETVARYAKVDLDKRPPQITDSSAVEISVGDMSTAPLVFPYEVTSTDNENLLLIAETQGYVEWSARLSWSNGVESGELTIDDEGHPFRTASSAPGSPSAVPYGGGEWLTE